MLDQKFNYIAYIKFMLSECISNKKCILKTYVYTAPGQVFHVFIPFQTKV
jgi:hypothetical protein